MTKKLTEERPRPWEYVDYRAFLQDLVVHLRKTRRGFSYRQIAIKAGFRTPNYLRLVADGTRTLSVASINRFADALGLEPKDRQAFELLVLLSRATSDADRNRYLEQLRKFKSATTASLLTEYDIYSSWYALPIREMVTLAEFNADPRWIGRRLRPHVSPSQVRAALDLLLSAGMLRKTDEGRLERVAPNLATPSTVVSLSIRNFHRAMLEHARDALDALPTSERNVTAVTTTLTRAQYEEMCRRIEAFRNELLEAFEQGTTASADAEVYHVGFQVVPVTRKE